MKRPSVTRTPASASLRVSRALVFMNSSSLVLAVILVSAAA